MLHQTLFIFDIETIPDTAAVRGLTGFISEDETALCEELTRYHLEITDGKNGFHRQPFHKVVAISFLKAEIRREKDSESYILQELRSGGTETSEEKELVQGFFTHVGKMLPRLVSFNGRTFDLPVLKYRAMVHGVSAPWLYKSGDKWNSYTQRYSLDWHCDLLEALSDFGASARIKMNEACAVLGFPGKTGIDGGKVLDYYREGRIAEIRNYCETDVLNTYLLYLRYQQHTGTLSTAHYNDAVQSVLDYIGKEKAARPYLEEFEKAWEESAGGRFRL